MTDQISLVDDVLGLRSVVFPYWVQYSVKCGLKDLADSIFNLFSDLGTRW